MNKKTRTNLGVILIVGIIIIGILGTTGNLTFPLAVGDTFTPIYCNDYSFTCCIEDVDFSSLESITDEIYWQCPTSASKCEITSYSTPYSTTSWYTGSNGCYMDSFFGLDDYWVCNDEKIGKKTFLSPGEFVWISIPTSRYSNVQGSINVKVYSEDLVFCGRAGCTIGVPVLGADGCTFNPSATYKDGKLVSYKTSSTSYTVGLGSCLLTFVSGDRHICGNIEEQCETDNDCRGHTYGNYECIGRTLQEYGCRTFSKPSYLEDYSGGYAYKPFQGDNDGQESDLSRCEIVSTRSVQCCGDTDCGSNAFCDTNDWTCKETAECNQDADCGVSIQCDINTKQLKQPDCSLGKCSFDIIQEVECCGDSDCAVGFFCSNEYDCLESIPTKTQCPFECCENEQSYFDRPCPADKPYCVNNVCKEEDIPEIPCEDCDAYVMNQLFGSFWESKSCTPKLTQKFGLCFGSFIKLFLLPIILIFVTLFGYNFFQTTTQLKIRNKGIAFLVSLLIAGLLAWITFVLFWFGIILSFLVLGIIILFRLFVPKSLRTRLRG